MNGIEFLRIIKADDDFKSIPVELEDFVNAVKAIDVYRTLSELI